MFTNESKIIQLLFSKSSIFVNCFRERSYIAIRKKIILKWSFLVLNTISYLLMLMNTSQLHLFNWQGLGLMRVISISFVYTGLLVRAFPQSTTLVVLIAGNLPCYLHFAFCLYGWSNSNLALMYLSNRTVSEIIYNIKRLKGSTLEPCIAGELKLEGGLDWKWAT